MRTYQNSIQTDATKWWNSMSFDQQQIITDKYYQMNADDVDEEKQKIMYIKEHPGKESEGLVPTREMAKNWWYDELTLTDQRSLKEKHKTFDIYQLYLKEHTVKEESGTKDEYNGMPWENNGQRESLEPPTEEKDTPVEGTPLSILAEELKSYGIRKHLNVNDFGYSEAERRICNRIISWQKEQDREVIQTLLDALNKVKRIENAAFKLPGFNPELLKADLQSAITKAEKFLQGKS